MQKNIIPRIKECYQAFSFFNPQLNYWIIVQTFILLGARSTVALFSLALSYFINKMTHITFLEVITISVMGIRKIVWNNKIGVLILLLCTIL